MRRREFFKLGLTGFGAAVLAKKGFALEYYPMPSEKKWAVVYSTWCGSSRDAAVWISEGMGGIADVFDVRENPDLTGFDHIIIGGGIRYSVTSQELQDYIRQNKPLLKEKVRGFFAVCGNMGNPVGPQQTVTFIDNHLAKLCDLSNMPSRVFLGRITKSLMDPQTAVSMAGAQDYDNLKRTECMAFGQEVLQNVTSAEKAGSRLLKDLELDQNYPNPFNPSSRIDYSLNRPGKVILRVYDANGRKVRTLLDGSQPSGEHHINWDGRDDLGNNVTSGAYFYSLNFNDHVISKKMLKVK
jgi:menaquinone-dependent protoporphyrinogen IX oxidase